MPECRDCGNTTRFYETTTGRRTVVYDAEGGLRTIDSNTTLDVLDRVCANCRSENVRGTLTDTSLDSQ